METLFELSCNAFCKHINPLCLDDQKKWSEELRSLPSVVLEDLVQYFCPAALIAFNDSLEKSGVKLNDLKVSL